MDPIAIKFLMVILVTITIGTMLEKEKKMSKGFPGMQFSFLPVAFSLKLRRRLKLLEQPMEILEFPLGLKNFGHLSGFQKCLRNLVKTKQNFQLND